MNEPRAYSSDQLRDKLLDQIAGIARHWATLPDGGDHTAMDRCNGVALSILTLLDGHSGLPSVDIVFRPSEGDKAFHIAEGENWIEPGTTISDILHDHYYRFAKQ